MAGSSLAPRFPSKTGEKESPGDRRHRKLPATLPRSSTSPASFSPRSPSSAPQKPEMEFVRLRSVADERYVHASDDGRTVMLHARRESYNAIWTVERRICVDLQGNKMAVLLLRGVYGRYLGSLEKMPTMWPGRTVIAAQLDCDKQRVDSIMWHPVLCEETEFESIAGHHLLNFHVPTLSQAHLWKVECVPRSRFARPQPSINEARPTWLKKVLDYIQSLWHEERQINWVLAHSAGNVEEKYSASFMFSGSDLCSLRKKFGEFVSLPTIMCIRAGRFGKPTPLCLDLPKTEGPFDIVLFLKDTPGGAKLGFPDVTHQEAPLPPVSTIELMNRR